MKRDIVPGHQFVPPHRHSANDRANNQDCGHNPNLLRTFNQLLQIQPRDLRNRTIQSSFDPLPAAPFTRDSLRNLFTVVRHSAILRMEGQLPRTSRIYGSQGC